MKRKKRIENIRVRRRKLQRYDLKKVGMLTVSIVFILYISFFCGTKIKSGGLKWKNNLVASNHTRTAASYNQYTDSEEVKDYDQIEDEYLGEENVVDTMQEKNIIRMANEKIVRKKLTKASQGIQDGEGEAGKEQPTLGDSTAIVDGKVVLSITDYEVLQRIVEAEATGLDEKSKILVANVLLNRLRSSEFPNTIEEIVFQRVNGVVQFQPVSDGRYDKVTIQDDTVEAVNKALAGVDYSQGALYFLARSGSRKSSVTWFDNNLTWLFEHEGHEFYK